MQNDRTKEQLMSGLHSLRQQVAVLKASETKRQKGEDWFKGVLDSIQEAIIVVDNNGKIRSANLQTEKLFQHKREELYDQTVEILLPERLRRKHHDHRATYALNPKARPMGMDMNFVGLRKDGSEFPADISLSPMRTDEGVLFIAAIQDVTERKHADDQLREHALQLRESEERFRTIFEKASAGIALMAIEGTFLTVNERFCDIVGYNEGELLKLHWQDITYPRDLKTGEDKVRQALTGEIQFFSFEKGYVKKDGSLVWVHLTASLLRSQTGEPKYFISIIDDITHRKQSHEKIREQAELLEVAQETIIVRDLENRVLYWNRSAENKYGWSKQEAIGRKLSDLLFRHDQSQLQDATKALFRDGKWEGELRPLSKQDKELIVESRWTLVRDEHGDPKAVLAVCTDVTEKKKIEDQFLRVQRMETIGTLAAGIAHDLNNILSPVLMGVEILKTNVSDASSQRVIATMESSVSRGSEVIKQLLLFGKGVETKRTIVQSATVIRETENILRESFPKNIRVEVKLSDRLGAISADMTQISQVLMNLCVNARDAMPNGGTLAVSAENILLDEHYARMNVEAKAGPYVLIQVVDSGAGIPKEALEKIFEPFFTTKPTGKGSGLGLATAQNLIKKHEGFITVYSQVGRGTTFKVYLPALETREPSAHQQSRAELPRGHGELVLVVDDESSIADVAKEILELHGYRAITANDGTEALALFASRKNEISVVLTDLMMPYLDGPSTIRALRRLKPQQKIIVMTGFASDGKIEDFRSQVSATLLKPFTAELLLTTLRDVLSGAKV